MVSFEAVLGWDKLATLQAALDKVDIPGFVQDIVMSARASQDHATPAECLECRVQVCQCVRLFVVGHDADPLQSPICVEHAEEACRPRKVVNNLDARRVAIAVAARCKCVDTRAVLVVLMSPQVIVTATV